MIYSQSWIVLSKLICSPRIVLYFDNQQSVSSLLPSSQIFTLVVVILQWNHLQLATTWSSLSKFYLRWGRSAASAVKQTNLDPQDKLNYSPPPWVSPFYQNYWRFPPFTIISLEMSPGLTHTYPNLIWKCFWVVSFCEREFWALCFYWEEKEEGPWGFRRMPAGSHFHARGEAIKTLPEVQL